MERVTADHLLSSGDAAASLHQQDDNNKGCPGRQPLTYPGEGRGSNPRQPEPQSGTLPTELPSPYFKDYKINRIPAIFKIYLLGLKWIIYGHHRPSSSFITPGTWQGLS